MTANEFMEKHSEVLSKTLDGYRRHLVNEPTNTRAATMPDVRDQLLAEAEAITAAQQDLRQFEHVAPTS